MGLDIVGLDILGIIRTDDGLLLEWTDHLQFAGAVIGALPTFLLMFQTAYSPRWRRVVSAIEAPASFLFPPNTTTILKFGPDPNTVAVWHNRGPISCGRVTCTGGGNSN